MRNFKLTLCYDGTRYKGWQKQGNTDNTLQGKLETLLTRLLETPVEVNGCGRTDAGVHARMQVCSFRAETEMKTEEMLVLIRRYLPADIGAISLEEADSRFHARLCCREKTYCYRLYTGTAPDVFERAYRLAFSEPLNIAAMKKAAGLMCGTYDCSAFTSDKHMKKSKVRTITEIRIEQKEEETDLFFTGNGFLYNMVRIMTGTLLEVGTGKRPAEEIPDVIAGMNRQRAGFTAPPHGLFLWDIRY